MQEEDFYEKFACKGLEDVSVGSLKRTMDEFHLCPRGKD
jgi:hypothetical protein